jgi:hypothetical protein
MAAAIVSQSVNPEDKGDDPNAVEAGRKGGKVRAAKLTPEERSEIAKKAAGARWHKKAN